MTDIEDFIGRWPGKSPEAPDGVAHPAVYHMLDVAAVAERLIAPFGFATHLRHSLLLLTALHDLGKVGERFRARLLEGVPQPVNGRHWQVTEALLVHHDGLLAEQLGGRDLRRFDLYAATAGHHGKPPSSDKNGRARLLTSAGSQAIADSAEVIKAFARFWPDASIEGVARERVVALSWWLPGLVAAADWIGSNTDWFPPREADLSLAEYLDHARSLAGEAVAFAGLHGPEASAAPLFSFALRPMQEACKDIPLPDGPVLAIVEDETGAGKTEAALILAQRMMGAGKGRGLFFALPTMATADAMFRRARTSVRKMFSAPPSLTLAHGRAGLSVDFRDLRDLAEANPDGPGCTDWLADSRRRALLADVGVGTVDQALLAVLPTKYATLRLFALSSKILIVDEVHELGEPYMAHELAVLLRAHAQAGGSAILLTATLPLAQRTALIKAFQEGAGQLPTPPDDPAYPSLTIAGSGAKTDFPRRESARGPVAVVRLPDAQAALVLLQEKAARGAACVWVRNAVDDAINAVAELRAAGVQADLLHARFTLGDRKRHEADALRRFGKEGEGRAGRVLVATQVVESSLDLDFDVIVSDLAPMAALIQRAGRLWRHMDLRPADQRPVPRPELHVVSPDPADVPDGRWLHRVLDAGAWVYPLDLQWRTADALFRAGRIAAPDDLRGLIESVHGAKATPVPAALESAEMRAIGAGLAAANRARQNVVRLEAGYRSGGAGEEDTDYPTRLGRDQRVLMLASWQEGALVPWTTGDDQEASFVDRCLMAEVQVAAHRVTILALPDQTDPAIADLTAAWPDWKRRAVTVCPVANDGMICEGLRYDAAQGVLFTSPVRAMTC